jgi:hypothetical protein
MRVFLYRTTKNGFGTIGDANFFPSLEGIKGWVKIFLLFIHDMIFCSQKAHHWRDQGFPRAMHQ